MKQVRESARATGRDAASAPVPGRRVVQRMKMGADGLPAEDGAYDTENIHAFESWVTGLRLRRDRAVLQTVRKTLRMPGAVPARHEAIAASIVQVQLDRLESMERGPTVGTRTLSDLPRDRMWKLFIDTELWRTGPMTFDRQQSPGHYAAMSHAFEKWCVHRLVLKTDARNERSRNAITRLGGHFEGILRSWHMNKGTRRDAAIYSLLRGELR